MNVIYSSLITIHSLICITYILSILSLHLNHINPSEFNIEDSSKMFHISAYFMAFGATFIVMSFLASNLTYRSCGSLRTMLSGLAGMSFGLIFVSRTQYVFPNINKRFSTSYNYRISINGNIGSI